MEFKFIDLFAGIGGFHQAMSQLGGECVFASEIDPWAIDTYQTNYHINADQDVKKSGTGEGYQYQIPDYDILCAGFPCQPFSKAGDQLGFSDETKGTLFFEIARIIQESQPKYIILENVRNLLSHDHGNTIRVIRQKLEQLGYNYKIVMMSPHQLGVPQLRERVYILGVRKDIFNGELQFTIPSNKKQPIDIYASGIFEEEADEKYDISDHEEKVLNCWDEFYHGIKEKTIGFPIWSHEFKETYDTSIHPKWKEDFCKKNRELYLNNKDFIDGWLEKWHNLEGFTSTEKKFEWQAGDSIESVWDAFIQFRPSGIRVKRPDYFPALVAMVQIPIVGKFKRRLTTREAVRLQSFPDDFVINSNDHQAYKQFGNAVNVNCVQYLANQLLSCGGENE